ncbi:MAG: hypothetical protein HQK59_15330, partial [Deltaproteobacteria bacterium]|nr:hypothetical protein [Deltaproteobacteria bacterium]
MGQNQNGDQSKNGDQAKRYVQIPMDGGIDSIFAKSMDQIPNLTEAEFTRIRNLVNKTDALPKAHR